MPGLLSEKTGIKLADKKNVTIIGPATVGGVKPGCFKIGNTGGMMDNILHSKLYRPGSVAYVSRSGGMSGGSSPEECGAGITSTGGLPKGPGSGPSVGA